VYVRDDVSRAVVSMCEEMFAACAFSHEVELVDKMLLPLLHATANDDDAASASKYVRACVVSDTHAYYDVMEVCACSHAHPTEQWPSLCACWRN
jgi:hypothetical protein